MKIWCKLDGASPTKVKVEDGDDVDDLKDAIQTKWGDRLPCAAPELKVFVAGTDQDADNKLGSDRKIKDVVASGAASSDNPLIVKSPSKQRKTEEVDFPATPRKQKLEMDVLAKKFGGLLDRKAALEDLYQGLEHLAAKRGDKALNKKEVPVIGISAPSENGKTEFLRWVFNNCCTFSPVATPNPQEILQRINKASPSGQVPLKNLLVLFASFNQTSTFIVGEGPIVETTVERLLRSFQGDIAMSDGADSWKNRRYRNYSHWDDVMRSFSEQYGPTGFIFCFDELSKVRDTSEEEYRTLMDSSLMASQSALIRGDFCAIVGSSLSVYDVGEVVVQASGRTLWPVVFPDKNPEMASRAAEKIREDNDVFRGSKSSLHSEEFWVDVTIETLQSSPSVYNWSYIMNLPQTTSRVQPPSPEYTVPPGIENDEIFLLASQTALERPAFEVLKKEKVHAVVDNLHGHLSLETVDKGIVRNWDHPRGRLSLSAWRLLQFHAGGNCQLFSYVDNWVLIETRRLFYTHGPAEAVKALEEATMAVLELRKAMLQSVNGTPPTLRQITDGLAVHHNVGDGIMDQTASAGASTNAFESLPHQTTRCNQPCFYFSPIKNEKGVEGVLRGGFGAHSIFFQMKLYSTATPKNIKSWLDQAHARAAELGYSSRECIVQLFVTGAVEENVPKYIAEWPENSMVFANEALENLFKPFGSGLIRDIVKNLER